MARTAKYTYTAFLDALHAVQARGDAVSVDAIRLELGGGSFPVLKRYLQRWEASSAADATEKELPGDVAQDVRGWFNRLKDEARAAIELEYAAIRDDLKKREAEVDRRTRDLEQREAALAGARDVFAQQEGRLAAQLESTQRALVDKSGEAARLNGLLDATRGEVDAARREVVRMTDERTELRRTVENHAQSVGRDVADLRKRLLESVDALNQATKAVKSDLAGASKLIKENTQATGEAIGMVAKTVARLEAAARARDESERSDHMKKAAKTTATKRSGNVGAKKTAKTAAAGARTAAKKDSSRKASSPQHERRGHMRQVTDANGIKRTVWVGAATIKDADGPAVKRGSAVQKASRQQANKPATKERMTPVPGATASKGKKR